MKEIQRIMTGIKEFDRITGGIPRGRSALLIGGPGTGKTIFALQITDNSCRNGMKVSYLCVEESPEDIRLQARVLGWNLEEYEKEGLLNMVDLVAPRARNTLERKRAGPSQRKMDLFSIFNQMDDDTDVVVVDSIGCFIDPDIQSFRDQFDLILYQLRKKNVTSVIIMDASTSSEMKDIGLFLVYTAIRMEKRDNAFRGRRERIMDIVKMRSTNIPLEPIQYEITDRGIVIFK